MKLITVRLGEISAKEGLKDQDVKINQLPRSYVIWHHKHFGYLHYYHVPKSSLRIIEQECMQCTYDYLLAQNL